MTARELAEKIFDISYSVYLERSNQMKATLEIESLLSAALAEAENRIWKEAKEDAWVQWQKDVKEARAEAFEEAAKIAEVYGTELPYSPDLDPLNMGIEASKDIAQEIRRRAGEGK